jgi:hypothetical protein
MCRMSGIRLVQFRRCRLCSRSLRLHFFFSGSNFNDRTTQTALDPLAGSRFVPGPVTLQSVLSPEVERGLSTLSPDAAEGLRSFIAQFLLWHAGAQPAMEAWGRWSAAEHAAYRAAHDGLDVAAVRDAEGLVWDGMMGQVRDALDERARRVQAAVSAGGLSSMHVPPVAVGMPALPAVELSVLPPVSPGGVVDWLSVATPATQADICAVRASDAAAADCEWRGLKPASGIVEIPARRLTVTVVDTNRFAGADEVSDEEHRRSPAASPLGAVRFPKKRRYRRAVWRRRRRVPSSTPPSHADPPAAVSESSGASSTVSASAATGVGPAAASPTLAVSSQTG